VNFLAHFHLAWPEELLVAGGLEGDFHKGPLPGNLPAPLLEGVRLHRAIDAYTDRHPALADARGLFPDGTRRFAGILLDLCFDHFLSRHWDSFSDTSLHDFSETVYRILDAHSSKLSHPARHLAGRLREFDVLVQYRHWETVPASAGRIGGRLRKPNPLDRAEELLAPLLSELEQVFLVFYPELQEMCRSGDMLAGPDHKD
jgi:acyl carrier protein phosphodiesterase